MSQDKTQTPRHNPDQENHSGAHPTPDGETVKSRSADPGQSSYGGFTNEDPRQQEQQIDTNQDKSAQKGESITRTISGDTGEQ